MGKQVGTDWKRLEEEYINGGGSYRALGRKYGIPKSTVALRGKKGGWRIQKMAENTAKELGLTQIRDRGQRYLAVADTLLDRTRSAIEQEAQTPASLKTLSEVMKNIREIQMLRGSPEQPDGREKITVTLEGGTDGFAG